MEEITLDKEIEQQLPNEAKMLIKVEYRDISQRIASLKVSNEQDHKQAVELGLRNKDVLKRIETFRKAIVKPFQDAVKNTNDIFKKVASRFEENQSKIDSAIIRYINSRKKTESVQNIHSDNGMGRATIVKRMTYEIVDPNLIPREWLCPDEVKIGRAVRGRLVKEIPGIKIYEITDTAYCTQG